MLSNLEVNCCNLLILTAFVLSCTVWRIFQACIVVRKIVWTLNLKLRHHLKMSSTLWRTWNFVSHLVSLDERILSDNVIQPNPDFCPDWVVSVWMFYLNYSIILAAQVSSAPRFSSSRSERKTQDLSMGGTTLHIRIVVPVQLRRIFLPHRGQYLGLIRK